MKIRPIVLMFLCLALTGGLFSCGHTNRGHQRLGIRTRSRFGARFLMRVNVSPDANRNNPVAVLEIPPHPFVPSLDGDLFFSYRAPQGRQIVIRVFDTMGREVIVFNDRAPAGGVQGLRWDGRDRLNQRVGAGVYYVHLEVSGSGFRTVKPIVVAAPQTGLGR